jgi:hypothetical protein
MFIAASSLVHEPSVISLSGEYRTRLAMYAHVFIDTRNDVSPEVFIHFFRFKGVLPFVHQDIPILIMPFLQAKLKPLFWPISR